MLLLFLIYSPCSCLSTDTWATKNLINNKLILTVYKLYLNLNPNSSEFTHREHLLGGTQGEEKQRKNLNSSISCCLHCRWVTLAPQLNTKIRIFRGWSGIQQVGEVWLFVVVQRVENNHSEITHSDFCCELQEIFFVYRLRSAKLLEPTKIQHDITWYFMSFHSQLPKPDIIKLV